jgi:hypothetical protein
LVPYKEEFSGGKMELAAAEDNDRCLSGCYGGIHNQEGIGPEVLSGQEKERHTYMKEMKGAFVDVAADL